jgi:GT2 family glycosyltransferase
LPENAASRCLFRDGIMDLSIIMINYNTKKMTEQAVTSVFQCCPKIDFEIIIVDNSSDETQRYNLKQNGVRIFNHIENRGFGNACNFGAKNAGGRYLLFLNSDTIMHKGTLEQCVSYLDHHNRAGAIGERTLLGNGTLDHACKRGFPTPASSFYYFMRLDIRHPENRKFGAYRQTFLDECSVGEVDAVAGSFLMMPSKIFQEIGGFDESFFMYGEDLDLCFRIKEKCYQVIYYGKASITHLKGQSGLHTKSKTVIYHFYNAMRIFYRKHYQKKYGPVVSAAVYCGIELKYLFTLLRGKGLKS